MHTRYLPLCICLAVLLLVIIPGSAYEWTDHFTADTSGSYGGDTGLITWNTGLGTGWINVTGAPMQYYYTGQRFGEGIYEWKISFNEENSGISYIVYGSQGAFTGDPTTTGTKYYLLMYLSGDIYFRKVIGGSESTVGYHTVSFPKGEHIFKINWDITNNTHEFYLDGVFEFSASDNSITDTGYMGTAHHESQFRQFSFDYWQYSNSTEDSAPVAAFTGSPRAGVRNATITLTDASTNTPTSWLWWAPSTGTPCHNNATLEVTNQNPAVFPRNFGYCGICLTATNADGSGSTCKPNYLYIAQPQAVIA
jgi:PKD repeat protein